MSRTWKDSRRYVESSATRAERKRDEAWSPTYTCECYEADGADSPRRDYAVTDHAGMSCICRYCDDCAMLAGIDWNGETATIRPASSTAYPGNPAIRWGESAIAAK